jgi:hypothetical protein
MDVASCRRRTAKCFPATSKTANLSAEEFYSFDIF